MSLLARSVIAAIGGIGFIAVLVGLLSWAVSREPDLDTRDIKDERSSSYAALLENRHREQRPGYEIVEWGVIVPVHEAASLLQQCSRSTVAPIEGYWRPPASTIENFEAKLPAFLDGVTYDPSPLDNYVRQYAGVISNGRPLVYASFIYSDAPEQTRWVRKVIRVCDGGRRYWGIAFDIGTQTFSSLRFNGSFGPR